MIDKKTAVGAVRFFHTDVEKRNGNEEYPDNTAHFNVLAILWLFNAFGSKPDAGDNDGQCNGQKSDYAGDDEPDADAAGGAFRVGSITKNDGIELELPEFVHYRIRNDDYTHDNS